MVQDFEIERDMETDLADLRLTLAAYSDDPGRADHFDQRMLRRWTN